MWQGAQLGHLAADDAAVRIELLVLQYGLEMQA